MAIGLLGANVWKQLAIRGACGYCNGKYLPCLQFCRALGEESVWRPLLHKLQAHAAALERNGRPKTRMVTVAQGVERAGAPGLPAEGADGQAAGAAAPAGDEREGGGSC